MKKLLLLLFSLMISFNSYGEIGCSEKDDSENLIESTIYLQKNGYFFYLPSQSNPYSGENLCIYKDSSGQYFLKGKIKNGKRHGKSTSWYENGQKQLEENFLEGLLNGKSTKWLENGQIVLEESFKEGKQISETRYTYYDNNLRDSLKTFKNNRLNGQSIYYRHDNGQKFIEGSYKDNKADGKWTFWDKSGRKIEESNYKDGDLVDKTIFKYTYFTGHLKSKKKYKDGKCISGDC